MRLGLVARADQTGLGTQSREAFRHLAPTKTLIVDVCAMSPKNLTLHPEWFPGATVVTGFPTAEEYCEFLDDLDVVITFETSYNEDLYEMAHDVGVATVLVLNYEFLTHLQTPVHPPTLFVAPSRWHWDDIPEPKVFLPWPVATDRFSERDMPDVAHHFRHVIGWPAVHDRAGTPEVMAALALVESPIQVSIACQDPTYAAGLMRQRVPDHVRLRVEAVETQDYWDVLGDADVLLHPRRYGGLNLVGNEALANGLPTIMTSMEPNNLWLPESWLVSTTFEQEFLVRAPIRVHTARPVQLAQLIDFMATDPVFYARQCHQARLLGHSISWDVLLPKWEILLERAVEMATISFQGPIE